MRCQALVVGNLAEAVVEDEQRRVGVGAELDAHVGQQRLVAGAQPDGARTGGVDAVGRRAPLVDGRLGQHLVERRRITSGVAERRRHSQVHRAQHQPVESHAYVVQHSVLFLRFNALLR
jgi:hypothetical protein